MPETNRPVNVGAELHLYKPVQVLDKGYVSLVDYLGTDSSITDAARVSYNNSGVTDEDKNRGLINYLMKHRHTSPFEQCVMTFECKMPIFVAREWVRHRTARLNEMSGRYTQLPFEVYTPTEERIKGQGKSNKQGSEGELSPETKKLFLMLHEENVNKVYGDYEAIIEAGVAKEVARIDLPLSIYTKWVWQCDLHNLLHFIGLRADKNAQFEIREYANAIIGIVKDAFPLAWEAFDEHVLGAVTFSRSEVDSLYAAIVNDEVRFNSTNPNLDKDFWSAMNKLRIVK